MAQKNEKTNVMRVLDAKKVKYESHCYADTDAISGVEVASVLGQKPECVFKTLVTVGKTGRNYVFVVPVAEELDLSKDLLPLTGYIHGGCSPIGMKKFFETTFHETAKDFDKIFFSAGKIGYQVEVSPKDVEKVIRIKYADIIK